MKTFTRSQACILLLVLVSLPPLVGARDKQAALSPEVAGTFSGKTLGVTRRAEKPSFIAMTAGKAGFALLGTAAMAGDGNKMVRENQIADPADMVEAALVPALVQQYGVILKAEGATAITPGNDIKQIVAAQPGADIILDIRSLGWQYAYAPTRWGSYWVGYAVEAKLIEPASGKVLAYQSCSNNSQKHAVQPTRDQLVGNGAQLLKDVLGYLSWNCIQQLAQEEFRIAPEQLAARPETFVDPLAEFAKQNPAPGEPAASGS